jgi:hypothetical protein
MHAAAIDVCTSNRPVRLSSGWNNKGIFFHMVGINIDPKALDILQN